MAFSVRHIRDACAEKNTTFAEVERSLKIGNGVIARWERSKAGPPVNTLLAIADYLGVPLFRLLGTEKPAPSEGNGLDDELLKRLMSLTPEETAKVDAFVQGLLAAR